MSPIIISGSEDRAAHSRPDLRYQDREIFRGLAMRLGVGPRTCDQIGSVFRGQCHIYQNPAQIRLPLFEKFRDDTSTGIAWVCPYSGGYVSSRVGFGMVLST
ncbi:hypothetical protein F511_02820 [Dorcoceras hygrometricum]|uniref:Uncharacterized protein n=1 Tax=Dorcoceras hygrometricum TaxID=472368 RepID=A0A2Z7BJ07_9LAMI|nr:hypothetical protein F511_02820 [Dorcoceras hygrometricum]